MISTNSRQGKKDKSAVADKELAKLLAKSIMYDEVLGPPIQRAGRQGCQAGRLISPPFHGGNGSGDVLRNTCAKRRPTLRPSNWCSLRSTPVAAPIRRQSMSASTWTRNVRWPNHQKTYPLARWPSHRACRSRRACSKRVLTHTACPSKCSRSPQWRTGSQMYV